MSESTNTSAAEAVSKPGRLSAEAAYAAAASAKPVSEQTTTGKDEAIAKEKTAAPAKKATKTKPKAQKATATKKTASKAAVKKTKVTKGKSTMAKTKKSAAKKPAAKKATKVEKTTTDFQARLEEFSTEAKERFGDASSKAEELIADLRERVKEAGENAGDLFNDAREFNKANFDAFAEAAKVVLEGGKDMRKQGSEARRKALETATSDVKELFGAGSAKEFFMLNVDMTRKNLDRMVDRATKRRNANTKLASKAYQPIANRLSEISKELKKAA